MMKKKEEKRQPLWWRAWDAVVVYSIFTLFVLICIALVVGAYFLHQTRFVVNCGG